MKNLLRCSGLVLVGMAGFAGAALAADATATINATIIQAIAVANTGSMEFASIVPSSSPGSVTLGADNSIAVTGGLVHTGVASAADFRITGAPNAQYSITLPTGAVPLTGPGGATMTADNFTPTGGSYSGTLNGGGIADFSVGARLNVGTNQASGTYSTTFNVTVVYN